MKLRIIEIVETIDVRYLINEHQIIFYFTFDEFKEIKPIENHFDCIILNVDLKIEMVSSFDIDSNLKKFIKFKNFTPELFNEFKFNEKINNNKELISDDNLTYNIIDNTNDNKDILTFKLENREREEKPKQYIVFWQDDICLYLINNDSIRELYTNVNYKIGEYIFYDEKPTIQDEISKTYLSKESIKDSNTYEYDIIIFGGSGFVGTYLMREAKRRGLKVLGISRNIKNGYKADALKVKTYSHLLKKTKNVVIAIGSPPVPALVSSLSYKEQFKINGLANVLIMKEAVKNGVNNIILINAYIPKFMPHFIKGYSRGKKYAEDEFNKLYNVNKTIFKTSFLTKGEKEFPHITGLGKPTSIKALVNKIINLVK